jgi:hypothetical protein
MPTNDLAERLRQIIAGPGQDICRLLLVSVVTPISEHATDPQITYSFSDLTGETDPSGKRVASITCLSNNYMEIILVDRNLPSGSRVHNSRFFINIVAESDQGFIVILNTVYNFIKGGFDCVNCAPSLKA